ncbi:MAG TPA: phosphoenolpyruvate carboxykinase (ATP) [Cryomorphaceae bacterium]|jgi:phosphoenolpyruvate carboxykinase (ATP)|nr:phosphoenolpyruvate carboxykinase (ATP) [Cryomorphaceae bacterium]
MYTISSGTESTLSWISALGLHTASVVYQAPPEFLTEEALRLKRGTLTSNGVLSISTGAFTGRSPEDRFIVRDALTSERVWWGKVNKPFDEMAFKALKTKVLGYLDGKKLYVRDAQAGADSRLSLRLRVINEFPEHNQFAFNMFIEPSAADLVNFKPEWTILHAPGFLANPEVDGTRQSNFAILSFAEKTILIGGTGYTGEIKKGIFSALNFLYPEFHDTFPMHCSANLGKQGDTALFFGLSGTGKTTLSADPHRLLIGDDEHGWTTDGTVFNFEGGCYAKVIDLSQEKEPDIWNAIKPGAILENIVMNDAGVPDYQDKSITENTRVSYPIEHITHVAPGLQGPAPKNIFFLTCDAYGVLPPISKLGPEQAAYHFISGYTAKVAGTEAGVTEPKAVFSACFGAPFMPLHPSEYASMLMKRMEEENIHVWLVNTGWVGGGFGVGSRIKLSYTRSMITAALEGKSLDTVTDEVFGIQRVTGCPGVPPEVLNARGQWQDPEAYDRAAASLAKRFLENFKTYEAGTSPEILAGGPLVRINA